MVKIIVAANYDYKKKDTMSSQPDDTLIKALESVSLSKVLYALGYKPKKGEPTKWKLISGNSINIDSRGYFKSFNQPYKGFGALSLARQIKQCSFTEAVEFVAECSSTPLPSQLETAARSIQPTVDREFTLPRKVENPIHTEEAIGYLVNERGISDPIARSLFNSGKIYVGHTVVPGTYPHNTQYTTAIIVPIQHESGTIVGAERIYHKDGGLKRHVAGSSKHRSAYIDKGTTDCAFVFENIIDAYSYKTFNPLCKDTIIAICGMPDHSPREQDTETVILPFAGIYTTYRLAFDNDKAGYAYDELAKTAYGQHRCTDAHPPAGIEDWNDLLKEYRQMSIQYRS